MPDLPTEPVFTVHEAAALGWTGSALKNAVRHHRLFRVRRGVYTTSGAVTPALAAHAAGRRHPRAVISHRSAALLHGLPLLGAQPAFAELTVRPRGNTDVPAAHI